MLNASGENQAKKTEVWLAGGREGGGRMRLYIGLTGYEQHG